MKRSHDTINEISDICHESNFTDEMDNIKRIFSSFSRDKLIKLSEVIQSLLKKDFLADLPYEISLSILSHVNFRDLLVCSRVSRRWKELCNDCHLWRRLCMDEDISPSSPLDGKMSSVWKTLYMVEKTIECNWRSGSIWAPIVMKAHPKHVITCLELYKDWVITGSDDSGICIWNVNKGTCVVRLYGHLGGVWSIQVLPPLSKDPKRLDYYPLLVSGSTDRTARVWCLDNDKWFCTSVMFGHESTVRCMSSNSASYQRQDDPKDTFRAQNLLVNGKIQEQCLQLHGHVCNSRSSKKFDELMKSENGELNCRLICTGSRDASIRIWNAYTGECLNQLQGHRGAVRCVQFVGCHVISGSYDCRIKIWCCRTAECLFTLSDHLNRIYTLWFDGFNIISGSYDTSMKIWKLQKIDEVSSQPDLLTHNREQPLFSSQSTSSTSEGFRNGNLKIVKCHTFCGYLSLTSEVLIDNGQLITTNSDKTIRVWRLRDATCELILNGPNQHTTPVTSVQVNKDFIISSSNNGIVKLWCRKTGQFIRDIVHLDSADHGGLIWKILVTKSILICAAGCPLGVEDTKLIIFHFDNGFDLNNLDDCSVSLSRMQRIHSRSHRRISDKTTDVRLSTLASNLPQRPGLQRVLKDNEVVSNQDDESDSDIQWLLDNNSRQKRARNSLESSSSVPSNEEASETTACRIDNPNSLHNDGFSNFVFDSEDN